MTQQTVIPQSTAVEMSEKTAENSLSVAESACYIDFVKVMDMISRKSFQAQIENELSGLCIHDSRVQKTATVSDFAFGRNLQPQY